MEAKKKRNYNNLSYYDGSAVRKLNVVPQIDQEPEIIRREAPRRAPKPKSKRKPAINFFTFVVMTAAMGITMYSAINYLKVQTEVADLKKSISVTVSETEKLKNDNDAELSRINSEIDLEKIFKTAVNELGMLFPNNNKVVTYESAVNEYVHQYDSIPETNAQDIFDQLFK